MRSGEDADFAAAVLVHVDLGVDNDELEGDDEHDAGETRSMENAHPRLPEFAATMNGGRVATQHVAAPSSPNKSAGIGP